MAETTDDAGPARPSYEFGPADSHLIGDLARKMEFVGLFTIVFSAIVLGAIIGAAVYRGVAGLTAPGVVVAAVQGLFFLAIGLWTRRAGLAFQRVDETRGHDVDHLMGALRNLHRLYAAQYWICLVAVVLVAFAIVFAIATPKAL